MVALWEIEAPSVQGFAATLLKVAGKWRAILIRVHYLGQLLL